MDGLLFCKYIYHSAVSDIYSTDADCLLYLLLPAFVLSQGHVCLNVGFYKFTNQNKKKKQKNIEESLLD